MAQTGYTPILIYSSSTGGNAPAAGNLTNSTLGSELAINITDGKLFYKDNANAVQVIGWKTVPTTAGGTGLTSYAAGDLLYYASGTTFTKLAIGANTTIMTSSGTAPQWSAASGITVGKATNLDGGLAGSVPYQTGVGATGFLGIGAANTVLTSSGTAPQWSTNLTIGSLSATSISDSGNLTFTGTGNRITGDMTNATLANRVLFQTSTANSATVVGAIPSGTGTSSQFRLFNSSDPANSGGIGLLTTSGLIGLEGLTSGTGTQLDMDFSVGGSSRMRLFTTGGVSIGNTTDPGNGSLNVNVNALVGTTNNYGVGATGFVFSKSGYVWANDNTGNANNRNWLASPNGYENGSLDFISSSANNTWPNDAYRFVVTRAGSCFNTTGTYGTLSDERFKENVVDARGYADDLMKIRIVKYSLKEEQSQIATKLGVIAQELEQIFPGLIDTGTTPNGEEFKSVKMTVFIPMLVKAFQELKQEVDALKGIK